MLRSRSALVIALLIGCGPPIPRTSGSSGGASFVPAPAPTTNAPAAPTTPTVFQPSTPPPTTPPTTTPSTPTTPTTPTPTRPPADPSLPAPVPGSTSSLIRDDDDEGDGPRRGTQREDRDRRARG